MNLQCRGLGLPVEPSEQPTAERHCCRRPWLRGFVASGWKKTSRFFRRSSAPCRAVSSASLHMSPNWTGKNNWPPPPRLGQVTKGRRQKVADLASRSHVIPSSAEQCPVLREGSPSHCQVGVREVAQIPPVTSCKLAISAAWPVLCS